MKPYKTLFLFLGLMPASLMAATVGETLKEYFRDPLALAFTVAILFLIVALAAVNKALNTIKYLAAPKKEGAQAAATAKPEGKTLMQILTDAKPVEKEAEVMTDHNYDGIHELDNNLPPWWLWGFYFTIAFSVVYMIRYHVMDGPLQHDEYLAEVEEGKKEVEAYLATASNLVDETNVTLLTDETSLAKGKEIYTTNCVACHLPDGGGQVGPNLTDAYWLHGGDIKDVFKTIKYGVPTKGMIAWKEQLNPSQMQAVASYILSLQGTTPANPKAPEGELYAPEGSEIPESAVADSASAGQTAE